MLNYLFKIVLLISGFLAVSLISFAQTEEGQSLEQTGEDFSDSIDTVQDSVSIVEGVTAIVQDSVSIVEGATAIVQDSVSIVEEATAIVQDSSSMVEEVTSIAKDTTTIEEDPWPLNKKGQPKGSERFVLSGIRFGTDMRPLAQSMVDDNMSAFTLYGDIMLRNEFFITAEYGEMDRTRENPNSDFFRYRSNGSFYRFGLEYNVMKRSSIADALSFGFKYANSTFDQSADYYSTGNGYWEEGATLKHLTEKNVNVDWYEITVSLKITLIQNLSADFGFAYTIKKDFPYTVIEKNDIPGWYFNKDNRSRLNFQYRLLYRIPLWPVYTQPREPKKK